MAEAPIVPLIRDLTFGATPWKPAVRALADSNITRSGPQTIDGVALVRGQTVLLTAQTNDTENGPWTVQNATWTRPAWFDSDSEVFPGSTIYVAEGSTYAQQFWTLTTPGSAGRIKIGFDSLAWDQRILGGGAPLTDAYWVVGVPDVALVNARNTSAVTSTLDVASTSTIPLAQSRTDGATAAMVDVGRDTATSTGTALAGFGTSRLVRAENGAGTTVDIGRAGFAWTDPTASSEDSKFVVQVRTGGAALATCVELSDSGANLLGRAVSQCTSVSNASGALAITAGAGAASLAGSTTATVSANSGALTLEGATDVAITATTGDVTITASGTASARAATVELYTSSTVRHAITSTGQVTQSLDDGVRIIEAWGTTQNRRRERAQQATSDATTRTIFTFTTPTSCSGNVQIRVTSADITNGDTMEIVRWYKFKRRSGGATTLSTAVDVVALKDDATWDAIVDVSGTDLLARLTCDGTNQCESSVEADWFWNTYNPV